MGVCKIYRMHTPRSRNRRQHGSLRTKNKTLCTPLGVRRQVKTLYLIHLNEVPKSTPYHLRNSLLADRQMQDLIRCFSFQQLFQGILHQTLCQNLRRVVRSGLLPLTSGKAIDESAFFIHTELAAIFTGFIADTLVLGVLAQLVFFYKYPTSSSLNLSPARLTSYRSSSAIKPR